MRSHHSLGNFPSSTLAMSHFSFSTKGHAGNISSKKHLHSPCSLHAEHLFSALSGHTLPPHGYEHPQDNCSNWVLDFPTSVYPLAHYPHGWTQVIRNCPSVGTIPSPGWKSSPSDGKGSQISPWNRRDDKPDRKSYHSPAGSCSGGRVHASSLGGCIWDMFPGIHTGNPHEYWDPDGRAWTPAHNVLSLKKPTETLADLILSWF